MPNETRYYTAMLRLRKNGLMKREWSDLIGKRTLQRKIDDQTIIEIVTSSENTKDLSSRYEIGRSTVQQLKRPSKRYTKRWDELGLWKITGKDRRS